MRSLKLLVIGCVALAGCESTTEPPQPVEVPESELQFLRFPSDLAPLVTREGSFWAVAGDGRELVLRYAPEPGETEGERFLRFKVPGDGLARRPDGTTFQEGDSVRITVRVDTENRFLFQFEPSGLTFDQDHPAELEITYRRVGGDLDGDGDEDEDDRDLEVRLNIWKQERPGDPWQKLGTVKIEEQKELKADIASFTGFCIAA